MKTRRLERLAARIKPNSHSAASRDLEWSIMEMRADGLSGALTDWDAERTACFENESWRNEHWRRRTYHGGAY
jgi:hypothetical protein